MNKLATRAAGVAALGAALYLLAGFLLVPHLIERGLHRLGAAADRIAFNPFTLAATLERIRVDEAAPAIAAERLIVDLGAGTLLGRGVMVDALVADGARLSIAAAPGPDWREAAARWIRAQAGMLPDGHISRLHLSAARLAWPAAALELDDLALSATRITKDPAGLRFVDSRLSSGTARVPLDRGAGLSAHSLAADLDVALDFSAGGARFAGRVTLAAPALAGPDPDAAPPLTAERLSAAGMLVTLPQLSIEMAAARLDAPRMQIDLAAGELRLPARLEDLRFRHIDIVDGHIEVVDSTMTPTALLAVHQLRGSMSRPDLPDRPLTAIELEGRAAGSGTVELSARLAPAGSSRVDARLDGLDAAMLSPYAARYAGWTVESGTLGLALEYRRENDRLAGSGAWRVENLVLAPVPASRQTLPLAFAAALHTGPGRRIDLAIPFSASGAGTSYLPGVLGAALEAAVRESVDAPFDAIAALVGADAAALETISFEPGSAEIAMAAEPRLAALAEALHLRPALALHITGRYAPDADGDALGRERVRTHVALATAAAARPDDIEALDFTSPRTQSVLEEFAGERLAADVLERIAARFSLAADAGPAERAPYYEAVYAVLGANEPIADSALRRIARYRARAVADALIASAVPEHRLIVAENIETAALDDRRVPVTLMLDRIP